ncbi:MAG TPA: monovalent cation/H+ antiporter subunit D family protein [Methanoregula sp.]|nr:monovalent cation/H+ antiporter subunit D family protein [Methanoregula sp.]
MDQPSLVPVLAICIPAVAAALILIFRNHPTIREGWTILASFATLACVLSMLPLVFSGTEPYAALFPILPGLSISFRADAFALIFALTSSSLWVMNSFYSIGYLQAHHGKNLARYFFCFSVAISAALGVAFSADLLTMFICYEILTLSTYPLVVHSETEEARMAGRKYLAYLLTAGIFFLLAVLITYYLTGGTAFAPGGILTGHGSALLMTILFITFLIGFAKAAWIPLHAWLPSAMVAPTPVSALLHAVAVVKAGVFGIARIVFYVFGIDMVSALGLGLLLASIASFTIIVASMMALSQDNLKKRLAYSTISQLSYILLGVALLTPSGIIAALIHIPFHAFMKITLFFAAGAIIVMTGIENISEMKGIGRRMPITMLMFAIGAIGVCGLPPVCGIITKWYLALGAIEAGQLVFLAVILSSSILNVLYFFPIISTAFFEKPDVDTGVHEAPLFMLIPLTITGICSVLLFLFPDWPFLTLVTIAESVITGSVLP